VERAMAELAALGKVRQGRFTFHHTLAEALDGSDFIQESTSEDEGLKRKLLAQIDALTPPQVLLANSTSSLRLSRLVADCIHPKRHVVGHPFNPPHLMPLVEIVASDPAAATRAADFYKRVGRYPVVLRREMPGHIANRLASALWREAVYLVSEGIAEVADIDAAVCQGPGLRWAVMGPYMIYHLGGGEGGIAQYLTHLGPSQERRWESLGAPRLDAAARRMIVEGVLAETAGRSVRVLEDERDRALIDILKVLRRGPGGIDDD
jgi:carnitine 3-dehydrogenase